MLALISLFVLILLSFIVIRVASILLELTGLSGDIAEFQAISGFTGTGFTTEESESIISHASRRNIIKALMIIGNAGFMTILASLILTFVNQDLTDVLVHMVILSVGLIILLITLKTKTLYYLLKVLVLKFVERFSKHQIYDYHEVLGLGKGFVISKIFIDEENWMSGKELKDLKLDREGTLILSLEKTEKGKRVFHGAPNGKTVVNNGDVLTCYGRPEAIKSLADREKGWEGEQEHQELCEELKEVEVIED